MAKKYIKNEKGIVKAIRTETLQLEKPLTSDFYDINVFNGNMDKIEKALKNLSTDAKGTSFDNSENGMTATNVQDAIEENKTSISSLIEKTNTTNENISNLNNIINNGQKIKVTSDNGVCMSIPNGNLNDISTTGYFMGDSPANSPISGWVYVESKVHNNLYQVQDLINLHDSSQRWTRHKTGGSWSTWRSL